MLENFFHFNFEVSDKIKLVIYNKFLSYNQFDKKNIEYVDYSLDQARDNINYITDNLIEVIDDCLYVTSNINSNCLIKFYPNPEKYNCNLLYTVHNKKENTCSHMGFCIIDTHDDKIIIDDFSSWLEINGKFEGNKIFSNVVYRLSEKELSFEESNYVSYDSDYFNKDEMISLIGKERYSLIINFLLKKSNQHIKNLFKPIY